METIQNERLKVTFRHPPNQKTYHRFETIGVVSEVVLDGRDVFTEPEQRSADRFSCQGVGLCGEYVWNELGTETLQGEWYPKFGVGLIEQNEDHKPYDMWDTSYRSVLFPVKAQFFETRAVFIQEPVLCRGYAARITKEFALSGNRILLTVTVENCGQRHLCMAEYQHNFVAVNHEPLGPNYVLKVPFNKELVQMERSVFYEKTEKMEPDVLSVTGENMYWKRSMKDGLVLFRRFEEDDLDPVGQSFWTLWNKKYGLSVTERFDFVPSALVLWGIEHCVCTEVHVPIEAAPGERVRWTRTWQFSREKGE